MKSNTIFAIVTPLALLIYFSLVIACHKEEKAPEGAAKRCLDGCKAKEECPFDALEWAQGHIGDAPELSQLHHGISQLSR